ncbi:radical SAM protein [Candidatus Micrarchaeota archaeon]|nr:radical SAM protein [Candidatus Micrarchaeota archaeon]
MKTIYGPVPSWRFGRSLGVDPICRKGKICSFDCTYCQLGRTRVKTTKREEYVDLQNVERGLATADKSTSDIITFSGTGEPTLNSRIGEMIISAKKYALPVAVLTNSSMLHLPEVRSALSKADIVSAKLDASDERTFQEINRPANGITLESVLEGLMSFRKEFSGKLALQMMFIEANKESACAMAGIVREIGADEIQLDTPLRPSSVPPLKREEMTGVEKEFSGMPFISVYKSKRPDVAPLDNLETRQRRPE